MKKINIVMITGLFMGCAGAVGPTGLSGKDGKDGVGTPGVNGLNGHSTVFSVVEADSDSCDNDGSILLAALDTNDNLVLDESDSNLQSATICNGTDGQNGLDAPPTAFTPVAILDPCGPSGGQDEVFLKLSNGTILASFSDNIQGQNTRFSILGQGDFMTSDGSRCLFSIDENGNLVNEHY